MKFLDVPRSGSYAGVTSSRNRYGQYVRTRAIPVNPTTVRQMQMRTRFAELSAAWAALTDAQRAGWSDLALSTNRKDALGQSYNLNGQTCYQMVNLNNLDAGNVTVADAPAMFTPLSLLTATVTTTGGTLSLAWTASPLDTYIRLFVHASPQRSQGRSYEHDLRLIQVSAAAAASPLDILGAYTARFGVPVVGNKIFFSLTAYGHGFMSGPLLTSKVVTA